MLKFPEENIKQKQVNVKCKKVDKTKITLSKNDI